MLLKCHKLVIRWIWRIESDWIRPIRLDTTKTLLKCYLNATNEWNDGLNWAGNKETKVSDWSSASMDRIESSESNIWKYSSSISSISSILVFQFIWIFQSTDFSHWNWSPLPKKGKIAAAILEFFSTWMLSMNCNPPSFIFKM